jgi:hypothetical protein
VRAEHYCALVIAVVVASCAGFPAFAQSHEPDHPTPPTIEDVQKLVQTIRGDKAKLKAYCELGDLYEQFEKAQEKNDIWGREPCVNSSNSDRPAGRANH